MEGGRGTEGTAEEVYTAGEGRGVEGGREGGERGERKAPPDLTEEVYTAGEGRGVKSEGGGGGSMNVWVLNCIH